VRILAFSDIHRDTRQAARLAERAREADVVVGAGDFASVHRGLEELIDMLVVIETPTVLVPGNNSEAILRAIEDKQPRLVVCGHIHESAGEESRAGPTRILNLGPAGTVIEL
jgi:Icc-related predicted phosphoesterase